MSEELNRFKKSVVDVIAKRSANICSNPECAAITSGPASDEAKSVTVGEAAHVYGAKPGAARYDPSMSSGDRGAITNAIWLCRNCHKLVDADPAMYPAEILFEWRNLHENNIISRMGKTNDFIRRKLIERELEGFESETYLARQIIIDKPYAWEYRLTAELMQSNLRPILNRARSLERGHYAKPFQLLHKSDVDVWFQKKFGELAALTPALSGIINEEIKEAWGPSGQAGSPEAIHSTCKLFTEACQRLLEWEEEVRFTLVPSEFLNIQEMMKGIGSRLIAQVAVIPNKLSEIFAEERPEGQFYISVNIDLPEGWSESFQEELVRISTIIESA